MTINTYTMTGPHCALLEPSVVNAPIGVSERGIPKKDPYTTAAARIVA